MNWIDLVQDDGIWRPLVNAVMKHQFPKNAGNFLTGEGPSYVIIIIYMNIHLNLVTISVSSNPYTSPQCRHCRPTDGALQEDSKINRQNGHILFT